MINSNQTEFFTQESSINTPLNGERSILSKKRKLWEIYENSADWISYNLKRLRRNSPALLMSEGSTDYSDDSRTMTDASGRNDQRDIVTEEPDQLQMELRVNGKIVIQPYSKILPFHAFSTKIKELLTPISIHKRLTKILPPYHLQDRSTYQQMLNQFINDQNQPSNKENHQGKNLALNNLQVSSNTDDQLQYMLGDHPFLCKGKESHKKRKRVGQTCHKFESKELIYLR